MIIGITGSSGSGKSTVCKILEDKYHVIVINADSIAKGLSQKGTDYLKDIVKQFGEEILLEDGELNRPKLADIIYSNSEKREKLNKCTLVHIRTEIEAKIKKIVEKAPEAVIVIDAPLLLEAKLDEICKFVIAVISEDENLQVQRIVQRDGITEKQAKARIQAQRKNEYYIGKSQFSIVNNGELHEIERQIEGIFEKLR